MLYKPGKIDYVFDIVIFTILASFIFLCIFPFYYIFIYSISKPELAIKGVTLLPEGFTLSNYARIFQLPGMVKATFISLSRTVIGSTITVSCCTFFAFLLTKDLLFFRKQIYRLLVVTMYFNSGLIPWYLTMKVYHLNDSFLLYIIPSAISAYYIILIKTFIEQIPPAMEESAKIDGAGYFIIFIKLIWPVSIPIIATITVFSAVGQWNTWYDNYFLVQNEDLSTLQLKLYSYLQQASGLAQQTRSGNARSIGMHSITPASIRMTITMVVTLPILLVYPIAQKYFVKGIMLGAIKG